MVFDVLAARHEKTSVIRLMGFSGQGDIAVIYPITWRNYYLYCA